MEASYEQPHIVLPKELNITSCINATKKDVTPILGKHASRRLRISTATWPLPALLR
jgi:hypothetical protein